MTCHGLASRIHEQKVRHRALLRITMAFMECIFRVTQFNLHYPIAAQVRVGCSSPLALRSSAGTLLSYTDYVKTFGGMDYCSMDAGYSLTTLF